MLKNKIIDTISQRVFISATRFPHHIALSCNGKQVTYSDLNLNALKLAALISSKGILNQNIGILTQKTFSAYCGVLGILYAGCTYVPLNPKHPLGKLKTIIENAGISTIICDESERVDIEEFRKSIGSIVHVIYPEKDIDNMNPLAQPVTVQGDNLAYIMFTSGSTGEPKGVMVTHANVCSCIQNMTTMYGFTPDDRFSQTFDLSFDLSVSDMFCAWFNGSAVCVLPSEEIYCASEYIQRERISFWFSVPTLVGFMLKLNQLEPNSFPTLRHSAFCGEPLPQVIANKWSEAAPNSTVENLYGPTEATIAITKYTYKKNEHGTKYTNGIVPIGLPFYGQFVAVVDESLEKIPQGSVGELCVSGSQITLGYLNDPLKTNKMFVAMPWSSDSSHKWYRTGDLALINNNGDLECLGRVDSQIKIAGQRIELGEIEAVLRDAAQTSEVAVVPTSYENGVPQKLSAFIAKELTDADIKQIQESCQRMLQPVFIPKHIYSLDVLPINSSGKIDRQALKTLAVSMENKK